MHIIFIHFLRQLILFSVVTGLLHVLLASLLPGEYTSPAAPYLHGFFFSITLLIVKAFTKTNAKRPSQFISKFMLVTVLKLMVFFTIILVYIIVNNTDAIAFTTTFISLYILYTIFEVIHILRLNQADSALANTH